MQRLSAAAQLLSQHALTTKEGGWNWGEPKLHKVSPLDTTIDQYQLHVTRHAGKLLSVECC